VLIETEYVRLQAVFLAMAKQSDLPLEQARWVALTRACQELLVGETPSKLNVGARRHRAA
jgi:hypothetical protein